MEFINVNDLNCIYRGLANTSKRNKDITCAFEWTIPYNKLVFVQTENIFGGRISFHIAITPGYEKLSPGEKDPNYVDHSDMIVTLKFLDAREILYKEKISVIIGRTIELVLNDLGFLKSSYTVNEITNILFDALVFLGLDEGLNKYNAIVGRSPDISRVDPTLSEILNKGYLNCSLAPLIPFPREFSNTHIPNLKTEFIPKNLKESQIIAGELKNNVFLKNADLFNELTKQISSSFKESDQPSNQVKENISKESSDNANNVKNDSPSISNWYATITGMFSGINKELNQCSETFEEDANTNKQKNVPSTEGIADDTCVYEKMLGIGKDSPFNSSYYLTNIGNFESLVTSVFQYNKQCLDIKISTINSKIICNGIMCFPKRALSKMSIFKNMECYKLPNFSVTCWDGSIFKLLDEDVLEMLDYFKIPFSISRRIDKLSDHKLNTIINCPKKKMDIIDLINLLF